MLVTGPEQPQSSASGLQEPIRQSRGSNSSNALAFKAARSCPPSMLQRRILKGALVPNPLRGWAPASTQDHARPRFPGWRGVPPPPSQCGERGSNVRHLVSRRAAPGDLGPDRGPRRRLRNRRGLAAASVTSATAGIVGASDRCSRRRTILQRAASARKRRRR
jgi:hypothetical protein